MNPFRELLSAVAKLEHWMPPWKVLFAACATFAAVYALFLGLRVWRSHPAAPELPSVEPPCKHAVELRNESSSMQWCPHTRHTMSVDLLPNNVVLMQCVCPAVADKESK